MRPSMTVTLRCGSHFARLALPVELQRRRADDDRRVGAVGLDRRQRLDGLAEPLLVGDERAPRVQRVAHARPLKRRQLAAEHGRDRGDRLAARRARLADRRQRLVVLGAQPVERERAGPVDGDLVPREERVERLDDPRVDRQRAAAVLGAGQLAEGRRRSRDPTARRGAGARRRTSWPPSAARAAGPRPDSSASTQRLAPASRRALSSSASASAPARVSGASSMPVALDEARDAAPRAACRRASPAPTSRGRRGARSRRGRPSGAGSAPARRRPRRSR